MIGMDHDPALQESPLSDPVRRSSGNGRERLWLRSPRGWRLRISSRPTIYTPWNVERSQSEFRKAIRSAWCAALRLAKLLRAAWPWPAWARIAPESVVARPSWRKLVILRTPQSGAVLISVWPAPACAMPSPRLPMSWSRKSENGKNVTSFSCGIEFGPVCNAGKVAVDAADRRERCGPVLGLGGQGQLRRGRSNVMNWVNCVRTSCPGHCGLRTRVGRKQRGVHKATLIRILGDVLVGKKRRGDPYLVEIGVAGKREQRAVLALPAEPARELLGVLPVSEDVADDVDPARGLGRELLLEIGDVLEGRSRARRRPTRGRTADWSAALRRSSPDR